MRYVDKQFLSDDYDESGSLVLKCESPKDATDQSEDVVDRIMHPELLWVDAGAQFRDCYSKPVDICFSFNDEAGYQKRLKKVDKLIYMLSEFKNQLTLHWEDAKEKGEVGK